MNEIAEAKADRNATNERTDIRNEREELDKNDAYSVLKEDMHLWLFEGFFGKEMTDDAARDGVGKIGKEDIEGKANKTKREANKGYHDKNAGERNDNEKTKTKSEVLPCAL